MSVIFDKMNDNSNGDWIKADDDTNLVPSFPFSISLWVRFETNVAGTETIWFYGDKDHTVRYFVLEARLVSGSTKLLARLVNETGPTPIVSYSVAVSIGDWHLVTVVATEANDTVTLKLYLDDETVLSSSTSSVTSPNIGDYDRFALGRWAGSTGSTKPCSFMAEQVAIWNSELSSNNHSKMFADPLNDEDVRRPPSHLSPTPDIGHWVLAGHHRHGLQVSNDATQKTITLGDLYNEATGSTHLQLLAGTNFKPFWSCETPAVLYDDSRTPSGGPPARARKVSPSRYNPQFFLYGRPENYAPWNSGTEGRAPLYDNPNFMVMSRVHFNDCDGSTWSPPNYTSKLNPPSYMTQVAKAIADWFEYQGFTNTRGSEGGGNYEGSVYLQNLGWQKKSLGNHGLEPPLPGLGWGIPLEQHPQDKATDGTNDWACWFNENGKRLVKEYADKFWPLLKAELDRRGLCYPKRLHWDLESSPEPTQVAPVSGSHTFAPMLTDDRSGVNAPTPPGEILADGQTLDQLWNEGPAEIAYDSSKDYLHAYNKEWRQWYLSWQSPIRQEAIDYAMMTEAVVQFPLMKWSNYLDFVADNEDYKYFQYDPDEARNSPVSSIAADYSSPVLYPTNKLSEIIAAGYGVTGQSAQLRVWRDAIDACVNSSSPLPVFPWITSVGYRTATNGYKMTREDLRHVLWYSWKRGVNEFGVWISTAPSQIDSIKFNETYEECNNLVKIVKCMMNTNGSRTSRMGRTYRHCR